MINHTYINQFKEGDVISDFYVINDIRRASTKQDCPYLSASLSDASGSVRMIIWEYDGALSPADNGEIVAVTGTVTSYQELPQLRVEQVELAVGTELGWEELDVLVPSAPIDVDSCMYYLWSTAQGLQHPEINKLCNALLEEHWELFTTIPAAKSVHHAFRYGLLMHTTDMLALAEVIAAQHRATINRDLLVCGVILHDIGKLFEFELSPVTGLVKSYTAEGNLLGHSCLGAIEVAKAAERLGIDPKISFAIQHMILAHHGDPSYGAAKVPMTPEAELLHDLDMLDSRREIYVENLANVRPGHLSRYIPALERAVYRSDSFVEGVGNTALPQPGNPSPVIEVTIPNYHDRSC